MDIRPPKPAWESEIINRANGLKLFSRVVGAVALCSQLGVFSAVPERYQRVVTPVVLGVGVVAIVLGNEKMGSDIISSRLRKPDVYTPFGRPGANQDQAKFQAFLTQEEVMIAQQAIADTKLNQSVNDPELGLD